MWPKQMSSCTKDSLLVQIINKYKSPPAFNLEFKLCFSCSLTFNTYDTMFLY